jgi:hypothetical protein
MSALKNAITDTPIIIKWMPALVRPFEHKVVSLSHKRNYENMYVVFVLPDWEDDYESLFLSLYSSRDYVQKYSGVPAAVCSGSGPFEYEVLGLPSYWFSLFHVLPEYRDSYQNKGATIDGNASAAKTALTCLTRSERISASFLRYLSGDYFDFFSAFLEEFCEQISYDLYSLPEFPDAALLVLEEELKDFISKDCRSIPEVEVNFNVSSRGSPTEDQVMHYLALNPNLNLASLIQKFGRGVKTVIAQSSVICKTPTNPHLHYVPIGIVTEYDDEDLVYFNSREEPAFNTYICLQCVQQIKPCAEVSAERTSDGAWVARVQWGNVVAYGASSTKNTAINRGISLISHPVVCAESLPSLDKSMIAAAVRSMGLTNMSSLKKKHVRLQFQAEVASKCDPTRKDEHYNSIFHFVNSPTPGYFFYPIREGVYRSWFSSPVFLSLVESIAGSVFYKSFVGGDVSNAHLSSSPARIIRAIEAGEVFTTDGDIVRPGKGFLFSEELRFHMSPSIEEHVLCLVEMIANYGRVSVTRMPRYFGEHSDKVISTAISEGLVVYSAGYLSAPNTLLSDDLRTAAISASLRIESKFPFLGHRSLSTFCLGVLSIPDLPPNMAKLYEEIRAYVSNRNYAAHEIEKSDEFVDLNYSPEYIEILEDRISQSFSVISRVCQGRFAIYVDGVPNPICSISSVEYPQLAISAYVAGYVIGAIHTRRRNKVYCSPAHNV